MGETDHGIRSPDMSVHTVCRLSGRRPGPGDLKELGCQEMVFERGGRGSGAAPPSRYLAQAELMGDEGLHADIFQIKLVVGFISFGHNQALSLPCCS